MLTDCTAWEEWTEGAHALPINTDFYKLNFKTWQGFTLQMLFCKEHIVLKITENIYSNPHAAQKPNYHLGFVFFLYTLLLMPTYSV